MRCTFFRFYIETMPKNGRSYHKAYFSSYERAYRCIKNLHAEKHTRYILTMEELHKIDNGMPIYWWSAPIAEKIRKNKKVFFTDYSFNYFDGIEQMIENGIIDSNGITINNWKSFI